MSIYLKRVLGVIAIVLLVMYEGAFLVATSIGLSTTGDDAANLPQWFTWLVQTPWWVPALLIPAALLAFACWVFWPDHSLAQEAAKARAELKVSNDKAWQFEPTLKAVLDELEALKQNLKEADRRSAEAETRYNYAARGAVSEDQSLEARLNRIELAIEQATNKVGEMDILFRDRIYSQLPREIEAEILKFGPSWESFHELQNELEALKAKLLHSDSL